MYIQNLVLLKSVYTKLGTTKKCIYRKSSTYLKFMIIISTSQKWLYEKVTILRKKSKQV